jgi:hypothetical protein
VVIGGMFGGFVVGGVFCIPLLFKGDTLIKVESLFILFILIFFLGDNFKGIFSFAQNLRFVILGIGLLVLLRFELFKFNVARWILPFSIVATSITYALSPLGIEATARGISYFLVALVIFKCVQLLVGHDAKRFYDLLLIVLFLYFVVNLFLFFIPILDGVFIKGRYTGLMGNPNGLGLVAMLSYGIVEVIRKKNQTSFNRLFFNGFKVLLFSLIILTASRTSLFGVLVFEIVLRLLKYKFLLALALLFIGFIYNMSDTFSVEAIATSFGLSDFLRIDTLEDASGRTEVWVVAMEEIQKQPWLGKGMLYDNYFILDYGDRYFGEFRARHWYGIWNSYLSLLLNVGFVGLLTYAFFWYKMYALSQMKIVRFAFLVMCLFSAVSESWMAASMNAFTPLVFLCWALQIYQSETKQNTL